MADLGEWAKQNKVPLIVGGVVLGGILIYAFRKNNSTSTSSSSQVTLSTLHNDLQNIQNELMMENSYLSSGSSQSPLVPSIDYSDMASAYQRHDSVASSSPAASSSSNGTTSSGTATLGAPVSPIAPGTKTTATTSSGGTVTPTKTTGLPLTVGAGPGDFESVFSGLQFGYAGDASDYAGLN